MAISRSKALKRLRGLRKTIEEHLGLLTENPHALPGDHWRGEVRSWIRQAEDMVPHVGKKTGAEWILQISDWKSRLGEHDDSDNGDSN